MKRLILVFTVYQQTLNLFLQFAAAGAVGTLVQYITLITFVEFMFVNVILASALGFIFGAFTNYYLNYHYIFKSTKYHKEILPKFFLVATAGVILNSIIMSLSLHYLYLHYFFAQVNATILVLFWNFTINRIWTFQERINATK